MSFTVLPPQQDNRGSFGSGLMEGLSGGISQLTQQLAQYREQGHLKKVMGEWKDNTSTEDKLMSLAAAPISNEMKQFVGSGLINMETVKVNREKVRQKQIMAEKLSNYLTQLEGGGMQPGQQPNQNMQQQGMDGQTDIEPEKPKYPLPKGAPVPPKLMHEGAAAMLASVDPQATRAMLSAQKNKQSDFARQVASHEKASSKALEKNALIADQLEAAEAAQNRITDSIVNSDMSFFSPDNMADMFHIEAFRTMKGAQFKTAAKDLYIDNLNMLSAGAIRNQWIEKQIAQAFQQMGRSEYANAAVSELQRHKLNLQRQKVELTNNIADSWREQVGYVPANLESEVNKQMKSVAKEEEAKLEQRLRGIQAAEKSKTPLKETGLYPKEGTSAQPEQQQLQQKGYNQLPSPKEIPKEKYNVPLTDKQTGKKYITDGISWKEV